MKKVTKTAGKKVITESEGFILLGIIKGEENYTLRTMVYDLSELELANSIIHFFLENPVIAEAVMDYMTSEDDDGDEQPSLLDHSQFEKGN
jgi:hypothetical protein